MTLEELRQRFRVLANDRQEPFLWSDEDVAAWLSDAEAEAAIRGRLLLADDLPAVCEIVVTPPQQVYALHPKLYEIVGLRFKSATEDRAHRLQLVSREWLDEAPRDWHEWAAERGCVRYAVQDERTLRLIGPDSAAGVLRIEGYRLPLSRLENDSDEPEIHEAHHVYLLQWALHQAFSIPDTESFDAERSMRALQAFTSYFGPRPDADLRRSTRIDVPQHNTVFLP